MGWRELLAWLGVMNRQVDAASGKPDPHRWNQQSRANFDELEAKRRKLRGR